jgi:hypothetical protein
MLNIVIGSFIMLHGLVHLFYSAQSMGMFELQPGMVWPRGSWLFTGFLKEKEIRKLATIACILAAAGFVAGGIVILLSQLWWKMTVSSMAVFSSLIFILFWDGKLQNLDDKGGIGLLINIAILVALHGLHWPDFDF